MTVFAKMTLLIIPFLVVYIGPTYTLSLPSLFLECVAEHQVSIVAEEVQWLISTMKLCSLTNFQNCHRKLK